MSRLSSITASSDIVHFVVRGNTVERFINDTKSWICIRDFHSLKTFLEQTTLSLTSICNSCILKRLRNPSNVQKNGHMSHTSATGVSVLGLSLF